MIGAMLVQRTRQYSKLGVWSAPVDSFSRLKDPGDASYRKAGQRGRMGAQDQLVACGEVDLQQIVQNQKKSDL